jgi:hypothetical protein
MKPLAPAAITFPSHRDLLSHRKGVVVMGALIFLAVFAIVVTVAGLAGWTADSRTYPRWRKSTDPYYVQPRVQ